MRWMRSASAVRLSKVGIGWICTDINRCTGGARKQTYNCETLGSDLVDQREVGCDVPAKVRVEADREDRLVRPALARRGLRK